MDYGVLIKGIFAIGAMGFSIVSLAVLFQAAEDFYHMRMLAGTSKVACHLCLMALAIYLIAATGGFGVNRI